MALSWTKQFSVEPAPGQQKLVVYTVRFDNNYPDQGYSIDITSAPPTGLGFVTKLYGISVVNSDSYLLIGAAPTGPVSAPTGWKLTAVAPHTSQGTGGHQLNPASTVLLNKLATVIAWGE